MRISSAQIFSNGVDVMLDKQKELSRTEVQLASGNRIITPSDDPSAMVKILDHDETLSKLNQYQRNAGAAEARLGQEEAALTSLGNVLQRVRELTVQGNNDTYNLEDRTAIATEIREHIDGFLQIANTRDANGEYIFSGYQSDTKPLSHDGLGNFQYHGDAGQRVVRIGDSRQVVTGDTGRIFMDIAANAGGTTDFGKILHDVVQNFEAGDADPNALADIDSALGRILETQARVGARGNAIQDQVQANESFILSVEQVRSSLEDLDYAEAISRFNQQLTALQASQQSFAKIQGLSLFNYIG